MSYSNIVYKIGGPHFAENGLTYSYQGVKSEDEEKKLLNGGWFLSLKEAQDNHLGSELSDEEIETLPPTREELKQKADELGLEYQKNIPSDKLLKIINDDLDKKADS